MAGDESLWRVERVAGSPFLRRVERQEHAAQSDGQRRKPGREERQEEEPPRDVVEVSDACARSPEAAPLRPANLSPQGHTSPGERHVDIQV